MTTKTEPSMQEILDRLWIDLETKPYEDLLRNKTLQAVHHRVAFLLFSSQVKHSQVLDEVRQMQSSYDVPILLVEINNDDMQRIDQACSWDGDTPWFWRVPVRDVDMNQVGLLRLNTVGGTLSPCEHGYMARYTTVARLLHKDDLFMVVDRNEDKLLLVYRALAPYDRRKDRVLFERTTPGVQQPSKQYMELSPNLLVYVAMDDIEDAQPISEQDGRLVIAQD